MNQPGYGNSESDHLDIELTPAEETMYEHIMDSGRGIVAYEAKNEILQMRMEKALATGPIAVQQTVEVTEAAHVHTQSKQPRVYRGGGRGLVQRSDSEVGPFALEETGIVHRTDEQQSRLEDLRHEAEMDYAHSLLSNGYTQVEVNARLRARKEKREREQGR